MGIKLADTSDSKSVELLIGADVAGKLFTGNRQILKSGLVAFETLLGWPVVGKAPRRGEQTNTIMTMTSLLTTDMNVTELRHLDILGITDPGKKKTMQELEVMAEAQFGLRGWEYTLSNEIEHEEVVTPILRLEWDRQADTLAIHVECLPNILTETVTKRPIRNLRS
ncbi:hypothetical protein CBL_04862 [Carabus blaptoides fortunei]